MPLFHPGNEIRSECSEPSLDYFTLGCPPPPPPNFSVTPLGKQAEGWQRRERASERKRVRALNGGNESEGTEEGYEMVLKKEMGR